HKTIAAGISAMRISTIARNETGKNNCCAGFTDIFDYMAITRRKDGIIGILFVASFTSFIALIILPVFW
ncbi:MAG: hypothetical protein M0Z89_05410, partial [Nitrospiraceae bacterium]|nr:hypothetical protein [Nitrospiraceae bacterium]